MSTKVKQENSRQAFQDRKPFCNFQVDHMTLLVDPRLYPASYAIFRIVFGAGPKEILYEKRKEWVKGQGEASMTYAVRIGQNAGKSSFLNNTIVAVVQPSEPEGQPSHVREMLAKHMAAAHWQHIALRTPDLLAFHQYARERGVNFITPILKDQNEDLIQVFSGEWYLPGGSPSGLFFEFVQRNPTPSLLKKLQERNRQSWFRDRTFLGLYGEKEKEYLGGRVTPFIDHELLTQIQSKIAPKKLWEIKEEEIKAIERLMLAYASKKWVN